MLSKNKIDSIETKNKLINWNNIFQIEWKNQLRKILLEFSEFIDTDYKKKFIKELKKFSSWLTNKDIKKIMNLIDRNWILVDDINLRIKKLSEIIDILLKKNYYEGDSISIELSKKWSNEELQEIIDYTDEWNLTEEIWDFLYTYLQYYIKNKYWCWYKDYKTIDTFLLTWWLVSNEIIISFLFFHLSYNELNEIIEKFLFRTQYLKDEKILKKLEETKSQEKRLEIIHNEFVKYKKLQKEQKK